MRRSTGITTADRATVAAYRARPVRRSEKIAGTLTALLFLSLPLVSAVAPGGVWS